MNNINSGIIFRKYDSINIGLAVLFAWVPLTALANAALGESYQQTSIFLFLQLFYLGSIINAIPAIFRGGVKSSFVFFVLGFFVVYLLSSMTCQDEVLKKQAFRNFYLWCLPYFVLSFRVKNYSLLFKTLRVVAIVVMACELLNLLVFSSVSSYSQEVGYDALLSFVVYYLSFVKEKKPIYIVCALVSLLLILMSGSRGPLFCALLSFVSVFLYKNRFSTKTVIHVIALSVFYLLYIIFREQILSWLYSVFSSLSVSTRSIEMMMNSDIATDNIRALLRHESFSYAFRHPLLGSGFLNDRVYLYNFDYITSDTATVYGSYSHFFITEILMQFGLLTGSIILIVFAKNVINRITSAINADEAYIFLIVLTIGVFPLFVSRSWFSFQYFYLILGLLFSNHSTLNHVRVDQEKLHI